MCCCQSNHTPLSLSWSSAGTRQVSQNRGNMIHRGEGSMSNKFHVFISHRGPDTKLTLAYHLYDLLRDRGVEVFLDREELQSGERFPDAITEAIACSKIHVCILSSGYAGSVWCLKELVMMLQKYETGKSVLLPVFYDVEPSDVRHLLGAFGEGFRKLEQKQRNSSEEIKEWRKALYEVADISGDKGKGELCMTIVKKICNLLDVGSVAISGKVVGRETQLLNTIHDIMRCRQNGFGVTLLEISGIGGIGKTTFAKKLYNRIYTQYERYCFIENVHGVVEKSGVTEVHRQLLSKLFRKDQNPLTEEKKLLSEKLQNAEVLVVLDNIHRKIPLSEVFIEHEVSLSPKSIIIVTSREEGVLKHDPLIASYRKNFIPLKMSKLDFDTSKQIFCQYAFAGLENVKDEFNELVNKIVLKCDGIPLALTLLGTRVHGKEIEFWKFLWSFIEDSLHPEVKDIIKFSYDSLDTELEKYLFLDVATFFHEEKEELLVEVRRQSDDEKGRSVIRYALDMLKRNLLIEVSDDGILYMHDLLVDLGRSIIKDEDPCPGGRSRVWHPSDVKYILSEEKGTEKVKALTLVSQGLPILEEDDDECPWSIDAFSEMSSLEILILRDDCIEGDLSMLSRRLLWLKWIDFPFEGISSKLCLKYLRVLHLSGEKLIRLWEHSPKDAPSKLKEIILLRCKNLQSLPETMGKLRHLSSMHLYQCISLKVLPDCFGQLQRLKHLQLIQCFALERLPETFGGLTSLSSLCIDHCFAMVSLPESLGNLLQLERLEISNCIALECLPKSLGCLTNLLDLQVSGCPKLRFSAQQFQGLRPPSSLRLSICDDNRELADSWFGQIGSTKRQNFDFWKNYSEWHCQIKQRQHLTWLLGKVSQAIQITDLLSANNNNDNKGVPESSDPELIGIPFIQWLMASNLPRETRYLDMGGFWNLKELPQPLSNLRHLVTLNLSNCYNLQKLPDSVGSLSRLEELQLIWCLNLEKLPDTIGKLENLRLLNISTCPALKGLPSCLGNLSRLQSLCVTDCWMVEVIHTQELFSLGVFEVSGCVNLRRIVGLSGIFKLEWLEIRGCLNLRDIMLDTGCFKLLGELNITGCYQLSFPEGLAEHLPRNLYNRWSLSLSNDIFSDSYKDGNALPAILEWSLNATAKNGWKLNAKSSPALFFMVEKKLRDFFKDKCYFHKLPRKHVPSLAFVPYTMVVCFISAVYTADLPIQVPPPKTSFSFSFTEYDEYDDDDDEYDGSLVQHTFTRFDFGEEIHFAVLPCCFDIKGVDYDLHINIEKGCLTRDNDEMNNCYYPSYEAFVKEGWIIFLDGQYELLATQICNIFYLELKRQRLMSRAWTELPSQLHMHEFSALDIASHQITKISRHCNTCILEEETGLTWNKRRCLFTDDQALVLQQPKRSIHSFMVYPRLDHDLEAAVANLHELWISMLVKGKVVLSRKLQQIIPITEEEIPPPLNTLFQEKAFHSTLGIMRRMRLCMLERLKQKKLQFKM